MRIDVAVKFIIVLLVIMIVSLGTALIIMNNDDGVKETTPSVTTRPAGTTKPTTTPSQTTKPNDTTTPNSTTKPADTTKPAETTKPADTSKPSDTTEPDVVVPPEVYPTDATFRSNTGVALNLRADVTSYQKDGKVYVRVDVYLEHYSINIKSRNGTVTIDGKEFAFKTGNLDYSENNKTATLLTTKELEVDSGKEVAIKVVLESKVTYGGQKLDTIALEGTVTAK